MREKMGWGAAGFNQTDSDHTFDLPEIHITGEGPEPAEDGKKYLPLILGLAAAGVAVLIFRRRA